MSVRLKQPPDPDKQLVQEMNALGPEPDVHLPALKLELNKVDAIQ